MYIWLAAGGGSPVREKNLVSVGCGNERRIECLKRAVRLDSRLKSGRATNRNLSAVERSANWEVERGRERRRVRRRRRREKRQQAN